MSKWLPWQKHLPYNNPPRHASTTTVRPCRVAQKLDGPPRRPGARGKNGGLLPALPGTPNRSRPVQENHPETCGQPLGFGRRDDRDLHQTPSLRNVPIETLVFQVIQDGGPILYHNDSEEQERSLNPPAASFADSWKAVRALHPPGGGGNDEEGNPQTQERDFPLSWKAQTPRFPHSHRTATAAVLAFNAQSKATTRFALLANFPDLPTDSSEEAFFLHSLPELATYHARGDGEARWHC